MRVFQFFIFFVLCTASSFSQSDSLNNSLRNLDQGIKYKGKVKSVKIFKEYRSHQNLSLPFIFGSNSITYLNENGLKTGEKRWSKEGELMAHQVYNYDTNQLTFIGREEVYNGYKKRTYAQADYFWQDDLTRLRIDTVTNRILSKMEYSKSEVRRKLTQYGSDTSIIKQVDLYDSFGSRISKKAWLSDYTSLEHWTYKYDDRGNLLEEKTYMADGSVNFHTINSYDESNRKIKFESISSAGTRTETMQYNEQGDLIIHTLERPTKEWSGVSKYTYTYDQRGNWTSCSRTWNGIEDHRETRVFTYYE